MNYNYHTHTFRCNHAKGTPEEYIQRAIENGIKYMGFSDHFPYICRDGFESTHRIPTCQVTDYFSELYVLREKYKSQIDIKIGFEMEYYPGLFESMLKNAVEYGGEYLILGQHFLFEEHPDGIYSMTPSDSKSNFSQYVSNVIEGMSTGVFSYAAHPDLFNYTGSKTVYSLEAERICSAAKKYNVPLEINFLGFRTNRNYPNELFWSIAGDIGAPVTFGFDSHDVMSAYDGASLEKAKELVSKYKLNYIGRPKIIPLKESDHL